MSADGSFTRDLLRGSLDVMILAELAGGPRYGYQILTSLRERSGGRIDLRAGTLYPILHRLERDGCVRTWWEGAGGRDRKWYELTVKGLARRDADSREWMDYARCVATILRGVFSPETGVTAAPAPQSDVKA